MERIRARKESGATGRSSVFSIRLGQNGTRGGFPLPFIPPDTEAKVKNNKKNMNGQNGTRPVIGWGSTILVPGL